MFIIYYLNIKLIYKGKNVALIICSCGFYVSDGNHLKTDHHQSRIWRREEWNRTKMLMSPSSYWLKLGSTTRGEKVLQYSVQMRIRSISQKGGQGVQMFSNFIIALLINFFFLKSTTSMAIIAKFNGERIIFLTNVAEIITYPCTKKWTLIHSLYHTKSNSKWITGLMVKSETMKLQEENIEGDFCGFGLGKEFLSRYQKYNS